jgi:uncharacterized membrane protein YfcA
MPQLATWQWLLGFFNAFCIGVAKTGVPGAGSLAAPTMVLLVGDARFAAAWTAPLLSVGDIFAVAYWRRHADAKKLFSMVPWIAIGMAGGALALALDERTLRRMVGGIVAAMLALSVAHRSGHLRNVSRGGPFYGIAAGFASTVANAAAPIMNMYLLSQGLSKEQFVATGAWFFFVVNLVKVPIYIGHGLFSAQSLAFDAILSPVVICGGLAGLWLIHRIPQRIFDTLIFVLTAVSTILLFWNS